MISTLRAYFTILQTSLPFLKEVKEASYYNSGTRKKIETDAALLIIGFFVPEIREYP